MSYQKTSRNNSHEPRYAASIKNDIDDKARVGGTVPAKTWRDVIGPYVRKAAPATKVLEKVAHLAVHIQKPSVLGVAGMVSSGLNALSELCQEGPVAGCQVDTFVSPSQLIEAFEKAGAVITRDKFNNSGKEESRVYARIHERTYMMGEGSALFYFGPPPDEHFFEWMKQILDKVLAPSIEIRNIPNKEYAHRSANPLKLTNLSAQQGKMVLASTLPLLEGGRCILLEGKPGVGKTTMAQQIAREAGLGRAVLLEALLIGNARDVSSYGLASDAKVAAGAASCGGIYEALTMLNPGVIIVDDVDKSVCCIVPTICAWTT